MSFTINVVKIMFYTPDGNQIRVILELLPIQVRILKQ